MRQILIRRKNKLGAARWRHSHPVHRLVEVYKLAVPCTHEGRAGQKAGKSLSPSALHVAHTVGCPLGSAPRASLTKQSAAGPGHTLRGKRPQPYWPCLTPRRTMVSFAACPTLQPQHMLSESPCQCQQPSTLLVSAFETPPLPFLLTRASLTAV